MTAFYQRVANQIRQRRHAHTIWIEPNVDLGQRGHQPRRRGARSRTSAGPSTTTAPESELQQNLLCPQLDERPSRAMKQYGKHTTSRP